MANSKRRKSGPAEKEPKKYRLHVEVTAQVRARIERLRVETDGASFSEVIRRSLAVYEFLLANRDKEGLCTIKAPDGKEKSFFLEPPEAPSSRIAS